jgi:AcrR family transcriptional regulator
MPGTTRRTPRLPPEDRRAQLLDAAQEELADTGFGLVTVEAIAQRAGVTRPVIYDMFGDLESLLVAVIDRADSANAATLASLLGQNTRELTDPPAVLIESFLAFLQAVRSDPGNWRLVLMPPRGNSPELRRRITGARRRITAQITQLVGWGLEVLGAPGVDAEFVAKLIEAICEDAARLTLNHPRRFSAERLVEAGNDLTRLLSIDPGQLPTRPEPAHPPIPSPAPLRPAAPLQSGLPAGQQAIRQRRVPQSVRREQLLDIALQLLVEDGFGALNMEAIARRAGVNRVVIYRSFANLRALLTALMEREDKRVRETLFGLLPREPDGISADEVLYGAATFLLSAVAEHPNSWRLALARPESAPRELQQIVHQRRAEWARRIEPLVAYVLDDLRPDAPDHEIEAIARMLLTVGEEMGRLALEDPAFPPERLLRGLWAILTALSLPGGTELA